MKLSHQSFIILPIIVLVLFVVSDDVTTLYHRSMASIFNTVNQSLVDNIKDTILIKSEKTMSPTKVIYNPGPLEVQKGLAINAADVKLSIHDVIFMTNKNRIDTGDLSPLKENDKLDVSAQLKLQDMFKQQYFEHESPDGIDVAGLGQKVSYEYLIIGENLALGNFKNAESLVNAWMASPGHRANILNTKYTDIGVAVGHRLYKGQDIWLAVQHFGLPKSSCPLVDEILHNSVALQERTITAMEDDLMIRKHKIDQGVVYEGLTPNEQIDKYNKFVAVYNQLIFEIKEKISKYNTGVKAFNTCLIKSTS